VEFAKTEPLRVYAIACQLGLEDEMKIASSHTTSIYLPDLTELPNEFKSVPATEYHRLILLHARYRKELEAIATSQDLMPHTIPKGGFFAGIGTAIEAAARRQQVLDNIRGGVPLNCESLILASSTGSGIHIEAGWTERLIRSIFDKANALNLTV